MVWFGMVWYGFVGIVWYGRVGVRLLQSSYMKRFQLWTIIDYHELS